MALATEGTLPWWMTSALLVVVLILLAAVAALCFLVLFTVFSQSQGVSLSSLDRGDSWNSERAELPWMRG